MKTLGIVTATLALGALAAAPTLAQDTTTPSNSGTQSPATTMQNPMANLSQAEKYRMRWVYVNLDEREVKRWQAFGFDEATIRGAANIALRTGLPLGYVLRRVQISGYTLPQLAVDYGLNINVVDDDIPGMGMGGMMAGGGTMTESR